MLSKRDLWIALALSATTFAVFGQVAGHEFVVMDDPLYVSGNEHVRSGLSWRNIVWAFTHEHDANWIPLTWISLMADASLFGDWAGGYHVMSVAYHLAATLLLFGWLTRATGERWKSAFVAALFAVHPLHVESVAWLPERKDVLSTAFGMAACWAYVEFARRGTRGAYAGALVAFVCSLLSKQMLVTLPFLLLLLDWWPLGRWRWQAEDAGEGEGSGPRFAAQPIGRLLLEKVPFLLIAAAFAGVAFLVQRQGGAVRTLEQFPPSVRVANALIVAVIYVARAFWPAGLAAYYPHPGANISYTQGGIAAAVLCVITAAVFAARRRRYLASGWLWYLVSLVPVIGIVQIGTQRMADRYTYVPLIGVFWAVAWGVPALWRSGRWRNVLLPAAATAVVGLLAVAAWRQTAYWENSITLFRRAVEVTENNAFAHANLGKALFDRGEAEAAIAEFRRALEIAPNSALAHANLGVVLHRLGRGEAARTHLEEAVRLDPEAATARINLGNFYRDQGDAERALNEYREAARLDPENPAAAVSLANALAAAGQPNEAIAALERVLQANPDDAGALTSLGIVLGSQGRNDEAIRHLRRATYLDGNSTAAAYNLGAALYAAGQYEEARHQFERTLELDPRHAEARHSLGLTLMNLGSVAAGRSQWGPAIELFREAHRLAPEDWRTSYNLAEALAVQGETARAIELYRQALSVRPEAAEVHHQLGRLFAARGDRGEAEKHFREAVRIRPDFREAADELAKLTGEK